MQLDNFFQLSSKVSIRKCEAKLANLLQFYSKSIPNIPNHEEVRIIFKNSENVKWNSASVTFPMFAELIKYPKYTYCVLMGFICSIGGLTESLVKNSSQALFAYLDKQLELTGKEEIERVCDTTLQIFADHAKNDRVTVALLRFCEKLFASGRISIILEDKNSEFAKKILKLAQNEINGCNNIYKLIDGINFLSQYVQINTDVCKIALVQLSILLCHRRSYVRKSTAAKLFEAILIYGDNSVIPVDNLDEVQSLLSETNWEEPVQEVRKVRNSICALMGTSIPVLKQK